MPSGAQPVISPGRLSAAHSAVEDGCAACHDSGPIIRQVAGLVNGHSSQDDRCLRCHDLGPNARFPHSADPAQLARITSKPGSGHTLVQSLLRAVKGPPSPDNELHCAACHREHRGRTRSLTEISDQSCQGCHSQTFQSFSHGHPELGHYPYTRRTRIYFDHQSHYATHFADAERIRPGSVQPESCSSCHVPAADGRVMLVRGYEDSCMSCHDTQIRDDSLASANGRNGSGLEFFRIPRLSDELLKTLAVGQWPQGDETSGFLDLPPLMELLLSQDKAYLSARETLRNAPMLDASVSAAAEQYAWSIKELSHDLIADGGSGLHERLASALTGSRANSQVLDQFAATGFLDSLAAAVRVWFPSLAREVAAQRAGRRVESQSIELPLDSVGAADAHRGWRANLPKLSLSYQPVSHDDALMRRWFELAIELGSDKDAGTSLSPTRREIHRRIFAQVAEPTGPGRCVKCHTIDERSTGMVINWRAQPIVRTSSIFSHAPHTAIGGRQNCGDCHKLADDVNLIRREFVDVKWRANLAWQHPQSSGFLPIKKEQCNQCHTAQRAREGCLTCHQYHRHTAF